MNWKQTTFLNIIKVNLCFLDKWNFRSFLHLQPKGSLWDAPDPHASVQFLTQTREKDKWIDRGVLLALYMSIYVRIRLKTYIYTHNMHTDTYLSILHWRECCSFGQHKYMYVVS